MKKLCIISSICLAVTFLVSCQTPHKKQKKLIVKEETLSVNGKEAIFYKITQADGTFGITFDKKDNFNVLVVNELPYPTSIHWHGLILPNNQDGVANVTQFPIYPNQSYPYSFALKQVGTYFMHSHFGLQEQKLFTAPLIINDSKNLADQDVVLLFNDFTFLPAEAILTNLKCPKANTNMQMGQDLVDVSYDAFLVNLKTLDNPDVIKVKPGQTIRLRLINGAASSNFYVSLPELSAELIAVDGSEIEKIGVKTLELAIAQRADVIFKIPEQGGSFPVVITGEGTSMQGAAVLTTSDTQKISLRSQLRQKTAGFSYTLEKSIKAKEPLKAKAIDQNIEMILGGSMKNYTWSINNQVWPNITPLVVKNGERVAVRFNNTTSMAHPMHLHGHVFQITEINGEKVSGAKRDTVLVLPRSTLTIEFDADNPGVWPFHCHNLYHQAAGMMTLLKYQD